MKTAASREVFMGCVEQVDLYRTADATEWVNEMPARHVLRGKFLWLDHRRWCRVGRNHVGREVWLINE